MKHMQNKILIIAFSFFALNGKAQVLVAAKDAVQTALLIAINGTETELQVEKMANNNAEIAKLEVLKEYGEKQLDLTEKIYKHYQDVLEAVETVSTSISTYKRVEQFLLNINQIMKLYGDYGVSLSFSSIYDLDKYINPSQHTRYINQISEIYSESEKLSNRMKKIVFNNRGEGVSATDFERYQAIKELNEESRILLNRMESLINTMIYLIPYSNLNSKSNIELKKSFYSYETYAE